METIIFACIAAFFAGFVDAIAGGGGLIQVPALLFLFPNLPIVNILGTNKLSMACGTVMSSMHYVRKFKIKLTEVLPGMIAAFLCSVLGAKVVSTLNDNVLKPIIVILLIGIGIYTFVKKNFGLTSHKKIEGYQLKITLIIISAILGFYDGFFGPGTGSLLMFSLVGVIGYDFLEGSAFSKLINLSANLAAVLFFAFYGHIMYSIAIPMIFFNMGGNFLGAKLAIKKGAGFVRWVFLLVIIGVLIQFVIR